MDKSTKSALAALADNVKFLMDNHAELTSGPAIKRAVGLSPSNITRIKQQEVAVGIDMLDTLAGAFGVEPWELLVPDQETRDAVKAVRKIQKKS